MKPVTVAILASVGAVAAVYLITRGARAAGDTFGQVITATGEAINPVSDRNLAYQGVNAVGGAITGQGEDFSLGVWLWEKLNPDKVQQEMTGQRPAIGGGSRGFY